MKFFFGISTIIRILKIKNCTLIIVKMNYLTKIIYYYTIKKIIDRIDLIKTFINITMQFQSLLKIFSDNKNMFFMLTF